MLTRFAILSSLVLLIMACREEIAPVHSPEEAKKTFRLAEDLDVQLVASEPMVQEPVFMTFDEVGRLWVVEMRGFMPNIDQEGENDPVGRISVLIDLDNDGMMDSSVVFIDSLVLPRSLAVVRDGLLVAERIPLWFVEDQDGDLKADRKILIDSTYGGQGMPEHSPNGLWRGLDNWYYNAKSTFRYKRSGNTWIKDTTEFRGQWGISHDDLGRLYYNYNWSQLHADLVPPNYLNRNKNHQPTTGIDHGLTIDRRIFPARPNPATNRGYIEGTLDSEGKLLEFTSACAPFVYRGATLPQFSGDVFVAEPAGNLIKRNVVDYRDPVLSAQSPYPDHDFLASTDERFRPVFFTSGPDGALYFADMYRGIIEHGPYMTPYLREQTVSRGLDKHIHLGRIWRIVPKGFQQPSLLIDRRSGPDRLVPLLEHPNGWYRDIAQRLLVEQEDRSVKDALENLVSQSDSKYGKIHALYTLEGLQLLSPEICLTGMAQPEEEVQAVALRLIEPLIKHDPTLLPEVVQFMNEHLNSGKYLALQIALTAGILPPEQKITVLINVFEQYGQLGLMRDAILSSLEDQEYRMLEKIYLKSDDNDAQRSASEILQEMLATAIAKNGNAGQISGLLDKVSLTADTLDWKQNAVLRGLSLGRVADREPIKLAKKPPLESQEDQLDAATLARYHQIKTMIAWPGHYPDTASRTRQQQLTPQEQELFTLGRQHFTTSCSGCHGSEGEGLSRFAPPLTGSEWVLGDENRLALLVLHGVEGPIEVNGKTYGAPEILPVMPSHSILDDRVIAAILTYIRCEWGHTAAPVHPRTVARLRHTTQGRVQPWKVEDLNKHVEAMEDI